MSDERPDGFYWVNTMQGWTVLRWTREGWWIDMADYGIRQDFITVIGPYIGTEPQDTGWRDIASAPKDGTEVFVWVPGESTLPTAASYKSSAYWEEEYGNPGYMEEGWYWSCGYPAYFHEGVIEPTHWMPVPAAPQMKESDK